MVTRTGAGMALSRSIAVASRGFHRHDAGPLQHSLRFVITETVDLVSQCIPLGLRGENANGFLPSERDAVRGNARRRAPTVAERIVGKFGSDSRRRQSRPRRAAIVMRHERLSHGDFMHAVFGQRDTNSVSDAIIEERTDADGALDAPILTVPASVTPR